MKIEARNVKKGMKINLPQWTRDMYTAGQETATVTHVKKSRTHRGFIQIQHTADSFPGGITAFEVRALEELEVIQ